jgi:cytochrome c5
MKVKLIYPLVAGFLYLPILACKPAPKPSGVRVAETKSPAVIAPIAKPDCVPQLSNSAAVVPPTQKENAKDEMPSDASLADSAAEAKDSNWKDQVATIVSKNCGTCHKGEGTQAPKINDFASARKVAVKVLTMLVMGRDHPKDKLSDFEIGEFKNWALQYAATTVSGIASDGSGDEKATDTTLTAKADAASGNSASNNEAAATVLGTDQAKTGGKGSANAASGMPEPLISPAANPNSRTDQTPCQ